MKKLFTYSLVLLSMISFNVKAQENFTSKQKQAETVTKHFRIVQMPEGLTEKSIKTFLAPHASLVSVAECSYNATNGHLKMAINSSAPVADVLKIFHDNQCELTFWDSDGIEKRYDPKLDKIVPVTAK